MLLFAHTGITLGAAAVAAGVLSNRNGKLSWFSALTKYMYVRVLMIGSMLPDIIDKPVGQFFFRKTFENGRIFSHTLLFLVILTTIGLILNRTKHHVWMLTLAAGVAMHLVLDQMWLLPRTFFWPLMGVSFISIDLTGWASGIAHAMISSPPIYIPEIIGLAILIWYGILVLKRKQTVTLLKTGRVNI